MHKDSPVPVFDFLKAEQHFKEFERLEQARLAAQDAPGDAEQASEGAGRYPPF